MFVSIPVFHFFTKLIIILHPGYQYYLKKMKLIAQFASYQSGHTY